MAGRILCPKTPRATERHTAPLRPGCRSIPAAKFRHSAELDGATRTALNSPLKGCEPNAALVAKGLAHAPARLALTRRRGFSKLHAWRKKLLRKNLLPLHDRHPPPFSRSEERRVGK